jgi:N-acetylglucosaminyl-diphospho-decaprenol L-rhamnosyltransferase
VVIATRDRRDELLTTLDHLRALPERPAVVVVDNGSADGTVIGVRQGHPQVEVVSLSDNLGAAARNVGVERARTPWVAFADDDSWWAPGALPRAVAHLRAKPAIALVAARIVLGPDEQPEPMCAELAASPLGTEPGDPGPTILGFIACGAVVERAAFLAAGGFHPRFGVGGEEALVAWDLACAGRRCVYAPDVVAHHHPSPVRDRSRRQTVVMRNHLWTTWLRRPLPSLARETAGCVAGAAVDGASRAGLWEALAGLPGVRADRRVVTPEVERALNKLR